MMQELVKMDFYVVFFLGIWMMDIVDFVQILLVLYIFMFFVWDYNNLFVDDIDVGSYNMFFFYVFSDSDILMFILDIFLILYF